MRTAWVEVDLGTLRENIRNARKALGSRPEMIFVVKDRAYGHGLVPVVKTASEEGVRWFAVVDLKEALDVRRAAPSSRVLLLGVGEVEDVPELVAAAIVPIVVSAEHGLALAAAAREAGVKLPVHLKLDTGMGRLGVWWEEAADVARQIAKAGSLEVQGVCTHFASVETKKPSLGPVQKARFDRACEALEGVGFRGLFRHVSSSRALLYHTDWDLDGVRPGIALYGYGAGEAGMRFATRPILQWKAPVVQVKRVPAGFTIGYYSTYTTQAPTTIATIAVGYADGYHRALSNRGYVLIGGRRCPVVGRVSMNWITADMGPDGVARRGDEAVLIGRQGEGAIWADELARLAHTIPYEILTSINPLTERRYAE